MSFETPPWPTPISAFTFRRASNTGYFRSPLTGSTQLSVRSGGRWEFDVSTQLLDDLRLQQYLAFFAYVQEEGLTMLWSHYPKARPYNYSQGTDAGGTLPWGSPIINGANQVGNAVVVSGLTPGAVFKMGDPFSFDNSVYRELHLLKSDVTADGSGDATFIITPAIQRSPENAAPILFDGHATDPSIRAGCEVTFADPNQASWTLQDYQMNSSVKLIEIPR